MVKVRVFEVFLFEFVKSNVVVELGLVVTAKCSKIVKGRVGKGNSRERADQRKDMIGQDIHIHTHMHAHARTHTHTNTHPPTQTHKYNTHTHTHTHTGEQLTDYVLIKSVYMVKCK